MDRLQEPNRIDAPMRAPARAPRGGNERHLRVGDRTYTVIGPSIRDPRFHLAAVIVFLQVLGQAAFRFEVSIAQILLTIGTCAAIEVVVAARQRSVLAWPASALVAGNGIALLLRVNGTEAGDWWSLHGAWIYVATAAVAMGTKYLIRVDGKPLFNPSNVALVLCFVALGTTRVNPLDLWWAPMDSAAMPAAYAAIGVGGLTLIHRVGMAPATAGFAVTFLGGATVLAAQGHAFTARWISGPVEGGQLWRTLVWSPETLVFALFMLTDPKTAPRGRVGRTVYGTLVGAVSIVGIGTRNREFDVKVMLLVGLVGVCALRPLIDKYTPAPGAQDRLLPWVGRTATGYSRGRALARLSTLAMAGVTLIAWVPAYGSTGSDGVVEVVATSMPQGPSNGVVTEIPAAPAPAISDAARGLANAVDRPTAQDMATGLMRSLAVLDDPAGQYHLVELEVVVVRDPNDSQAPPIVALRGMGTRGEDSTVVDRVFFLRASGDGWSLIGHEATGDVDIDDGG